MQVIKKVMKMDAAEPFNVPVNPVALGIPVSISLHAFAYVFIGQTSIHWSDKY